MSDGPLVSVLLPVFNGADYVLDALRSIFEQSFTNFEVIAINDGSTDESGYLLNSIADERLRVFNQANLGLAATLNRGISLAQGDYIARQDQDDLSFPRRLEAQVAYLEAHPECGLLGTCAEIWVGENKTSRTHDHPTDHSTLAFELLFNNPFVHSSVMLRRDSVVSVGGYSVDPERQPPEDYELWSRMARSCRVANLRERLVVYREVPQSMSRTGVNPFLDRLVTIGAENIAFANDSKHIIGPMIDVAAMTHSAFHRMSANPDIDSMVSVIRRAAEFYGKGSPEIHVGAEERVRILRYQCLLHRDRTKFFTLIDRILNKLSSIYRIRSILNRRR